MLHIKSVRYISEKLVWLSVDDGTSGEVDLGGGLIGPIFEPLKDDSEFSKLYFDEDLETIVWPTGADFAPEYLRKFLDNQSPKKRST